MGKMCVCVCVYSSLNVFVSHSSRFAKIGHRSDPELAPKLERPRFLPISTIVNFWKNPQLCQEKITRWLFHFVFHMKAYMLHVTLGSWHWFTYFSGCWVFKDLFLRFHPETWGRFPFWRAYLFNRVGSTTNYIDSYPRSETFGNLSPLWSSVSNFIELTEPSRSRLVFWGSVRFCKGSVNESP